MPPHDRDFALTSYLDEIGKVDLLTLAEEKSLARKIKKGDEKARERMIQANLRLVVKIAQDYSAYGLPLLDLISEGNIGLMKAADRFDPNRGTKFSTYAAWWIKQGIKRALANQSKTIRLPVHMVDRLARMRRLAMQLTEELGREPTDEELAEELHLPLKKVKMLHRVSMRPTSLNAMLGDEDGTEFGDLVPDDKSPDPVAILTDRSMRASLGKILHVLDERERTILALRFPLDDSRKELTLEEVGAKLKVTRERIRQLQNQALKKLRAELERQESPYLASKKH
ncbi:MAG: RNA polymerase sigma factor RpoD/SigA [Candidatus Methylacidiphilales bacterium]|nr:RNA polymerase sigma factor RpoD/SigA [Candidatus Methylacidiphilales bacterium]